MSNLTKRLLKTIRRPNYGPPREGFMTKRVPAYNSNNKKHNWLLLGFALFAIFGMLIFFGVKAISENEDDSDSRHL